MVILQEGVKAPTFTLQNQDGDDVSLASFLGKWVVLYFYPKDNTSGCTVEAIDFSELKRDFEKHNCVVFGISPDSVKSHAGFREKKNLTVDLLSDEQKTVLNAYGTWGPKKFMGREYMGVLRTTFLIDPKGFIAHVWENVRVKEHAKLVLTRLKENQ